MFHAICQPLTDCFLYDKMGSWFENREILRGE